MTTEEATNTVQCPGECDDDCERCCSGVWEAMCDDCRFYAAQDAELPEGVTR